MYNIIMRNDLCKKCGKCCANIPVDFVQKVMYRDGIETLGEDFASLLIPQSKRENVTFCTCKFLKDNSCTNPNKPACCQNFPQSPFAFLPEDCGYEGEIFGKNESIKQKVRKKKEEILDCAIKLEITRDKDEKRALERTIAANQAFVDKYRVYGAENW